VLFDNGERVELIPLGEGSPGPVAVDFGSPGMRRRRRGGHNEALGRAVGVGKWSPLSVLDGTAGLGRDSFILADLGCQVLMLESSPVVFALLEDGLKRARMADDRWLRQVSARLELRRADAVDWLSQPADHSVDVVYLDPMFPARRKSARVKKEMWLLQQLLDTPGQQPVLALALARSRRRVVVKRPAKAPPLEERAPAFAIPGKTVRFDVYLP
jgi:16S rRNA (guanine1516-N2)-methyltransferase